MLPTVVALCTDILRTTVALRTDILRTGTFQIFQRTKVAVGLAAAAAAAGVLCCCSELEFWRVEMSLLLLLFS